MKIALQGRYLEDIEPFFKTGRFRITGKNPDLIVVHGGDGALLDLGGDAAKDEGGANSHTRRGGNPSQDGFFLRLHAQGGAYPQSSQRGVAIGVNRPVVGRTAASHYAWCCCLFFECC